MRLFWTCWLGLFLWCAEVKQTYSQVQTAFQMHPEAQNWHVLIDPSGQLSLDEVRTEQSLFKRLDTPSYTAMGSEKAVWIHVQIPAYAKAPYWLWVNARHVEYLDFYLLHQGQLERHVQSGSLRAKEHHWQSAISPYLFTLPSDNQPREAYLRLQSGHSMMAYFELLGDKGLSMLERMAYFHGMLLGTLGLVVIYNLICLLKHRQIAYLWLAAFHLMLLSSLIANLGLWVVWFPEWAHHQSLVADLMPLLACMAILAFLLCFFRTFASPAVLWFIRIGFYMMAVEALALVVKPWLLHGLLAQSLALVLTLSVLVISGYYAACGNRPAHLVVLGLVFALSYTCLLSTSVGYQILDAEGLVSAVFWLATFGGLVLNIALARQKKERHAALRAARQTPAVPLDRPADEPKVQEVFLAQVNQELSQLVNAGLNTAELLQQTVLSVQQREAVHAIQGAHYQLLNLIHETLDILQPHSKPIELDQLPLSLSGLVTECIEDLRYRFERQGVTLSYVQDLQQIVYIQTDPARMRQLLMGLLDSRLCRPDVRQIQLSVSVIQEASLPEIKLSLEDDGAPLSEAAQHLLSTLTEPAQKLKALSPEVSLNVLSLVERVRLLGGRWSSNSLSASGGSRICIHLPTQILPALEAPEMQESLLSGARVLIVDDDETCRQVLSTQCRSWGADVDLAVDGKEALALMRTRVHLGDLFDAVIIDQDMLGMTGLQLATKVREDVLLKQDVALILLVTLESANSRIEARNAGINRLLVRPVSPYTLKTVLIHELKRTGRLNRMSLIHSTQLWSVPEDFRMLVAEDDKASSKVIAGLLGKLKIVPKLVKNGQEALQALQNESFDLVLMDCEMPVMDGYTATHQLRLWEALHPERTRTPVVALTAYIFAEHQSRAKAVGMDDYIAKPVDLSRLRTLVRPYLESHAAHHRPLIR